MKRLLSATIALVLIAAAALGWLYWQYERAELPLSEPRLEVEVDRGRSAAAIAQGLRAQGVDLRPWLFRLALRVRGDGQRLRAGAYSLAQPLTLRTLLDRLTEGDVTQRSVTIVEGWTFRQMREALARHPDLRGDSQALSEQQILERIGATETQAEGLFAPDTYVFDRNSSDLELLRRAYRLQQRHLQQAWEERHPDLPYRNPYEALIMASIVEKETGRPDDRAKVAAVFVNRLRRNMLLQSDPTTIYGLGESFDGNLRKRDLRGDTPYNTYVRPGLTPTPIALPGRAAIEAALNPAAIDALYFVARGDGSSEFSDDLAAHNRAVNRYQRRSSESRP